MTTTNVAIIQSKLAIAKARMLKQSMSELVTVDGEEMTHAELHRSLGKGEKCPVCNKVIAAPKGTAAVFGKESKDPSTEQRQKWADEGKALPDGSWPIPNADYLRRAIQSFGRGNKSNARVKNWIKKRARALGLEDQIPEDW